MKKTLLLALVSIFCLLLSEFVHAGRCVDNDDGTISDNGTGLMWQNQTFGPMNWNAAISYASGLSWGGHNDWRIPTIDELRGLYNSECRKIMQIRDDWYWSSTTWPGSTDYAYAMHLNIGATPGHIKSSSLYVSAVRSGQ